MNTPKSNCVVISNIRIKTTSDSTVKMFPSPYSFWGTVCILDHRQVGRKWTVEIAFWCFAAATFTEFTQSVEKKRLGDRLRAGTGKCQPKGKFSGTEWNMEDTTKKEQLI
jgi:hypothetical protein